MSTVLGMALGAWAYSLMGWQGLAWAVGIWLALGLAEIVVSEVRR